MSDPKYLQEGFAFQLSHFIEEAGEALAAAGKTQRWGPWSVDPTLPPDEQETNFAWLSRELRGVKEAVARLEKTMNDSTEMSKFPR